MFNELEKELKKIFKKNKLIRVEKILKYITIRISNGIFKENEILINDLDSKIILFDIKKKMDLKEYNINFKSDLETIKKDIINKITNIIK